VACDIRSDAARGEVADLLRARKGSSALSAFVCSIGGGVDYNRSAERAKSMVEVASGVVGCCLVESRE
jgi:hypothetical protein